MRVRDSRSMVPRRRSASGESLRRRMWEAGSATSGGGGGGGGDNGPPGGSVSPSGGSMPELCNMELQPGRTRRVGPAAHPTRVRNHGTWGHMYSAAP